MKSVFLAIFITVVTLASCGNKQDFGYNEKMTSLFYNCREKVDESYRKLTDGGFDADKAVEISYDMNLKEAQSLRTYINEVKAEAGELVHSEAANTFHAGIIAYMSEIADKYAPLLVKYVEQPDSAAKSAIRQEITIQKDALSSLEDKCLGTQIEFLENAGIKINTESARN